MHEDADPPLTPVQEKLTKYVTDVFERLKFAQKLMGDTDFSPFKSKQFVGFIRDQLSEVTTRYVLVGEVDPPVRDPQTTNVDKREDELKKKGFTVVGTSPAAEAKPATQETVDPNLAAIPAFQLALSQGFDPTKPGPDE